MLGGNKKGKVFVGLSGGVDSAVSAALLKRQGYDVVGVFIRIALPGYPCSSGLDKIDAMRVAAHLRIPFRELDLSQDYEQEVFKTSINEFGRGRTPNPDTLCNREIKFGKFYDFARAHGADFVATGHYAQHINGELHTSADSNKDQTYFLWMVPQEVLKHVLFPVGHLHKDEVRALAATFGLPNAKRHDSQGLCFLGDISMEDMLKQELDVKLGEVLNEEGKVVGTHDGAVLYTLGERHGFRLSAQTPHTKPHFVVATDIAKNTITVSTNRFPVGIVNTHIILRDCNWIGEMQPGNYAARFRYRQKLIPATLSLDTENTYVVLHEPHYIPLGQSLVLYLPGQAGVGDRCIGGGIPDEVYFST